MGISAFNCHEIHWQYTCSQAWWCNPVIPTLRRQRQERMLRPYLSYTVRQCFKTHNKNKSGFATNVKLCILSLSSLLLLYKEGRQAPESKQQPHKSQRVAQVSWGRPKKKKEKPRKLPVTHQMYTKAKTLEARHACSWLSYLVPVVHTQTKPGRTDWFRKMGRTVKIHVRVCWDLAIIFLTPYPPSRFWSSPLELWLGILRGSGALTSPSMS